MANRTINVISIKERIAISHDFDYDERMFILRCINDSEETKKIPPPLVKWPWGGNTNGED